MNPLPVLTRALGWALALLLLITLGALLYGHAGGGPAGLSLVSSYISEYEASGPHWPWIIVAIFCFAVMLGLLSFGFLLRTNRSPLALLGCVMLGAASMGMFFVAYAPMRRVEQPPAGRFAWWTPSWWFTSQTSRTPYDHGMADAYSDVHYHAIKLVLVNGLIGMVLFALGQLSSPRWKPFARCTIASAVVMAVLFLMGDHLEGWHGLWQRLGFAVMYGWLWVACWRITAAE